MKSIGACTKPRAKHGIISDVGVCPPLKQQLSQLIIVLLYCRHQRGTTVFILLVDVIPTVKQRDYQCGIFALDSL
ncbi:hypothetical protein SDC9_156002 [bioreactor metagenome]|uniref:Uncharacterized protein n=1 Tax=bioreactor metagenome TaxID=1076179 RepID=A0A645F3J1_9ZZZZ